MALDSVESELTSFRSLKFLASRRFQDCSSELNYVADVLSVKIHDFVSYESAVAAVDAFDLHSIKDGRTGHGTDGGIHARGVAAGSQDAYAFNFCHKSR